jgi:hypothetical protein
LWHSQLSSRPKNWNVAAVLLFSLVTAGLMARTGNTGGDIRHPEVRDEQELSATGKVTEGPVGSVLYAVEPTPDKFMQAVVFSKWWWTFMMIMHFGGLILIIGTVGTFRHTHHGIFETTSDWPPPPASSLGNCRTGRQYFDGHAGLHRPAHQLHLQRSFLVQDAVPDAAGSECGGILHDRHF